MKGKTWFWRHVDKSGECWLWTGYSQRGVPLQQRRGMTAYRFAWLDTGREAHPNDKIAPGCGNSLCVRPSHMLVERRSWPKTYKGSPARYTDVISDLLKDMEGWQ